MNTLLLDRTTWDLCLDASGNIAMASDPYSLAQDAASAIKLFVGDAYYNTAIGIPYFSQVLGQRPPLQFMKAQFVAAALTVPEVTSAACYIAGLLGRRLTGQVQVKTANGQTVAAAF